MVEPIKSEAGKIDADYEQALEDLGPWRAVAQPTVQPAGNGWTFKMGVGVATLDGKKYTALTAVARNGNQRARFWPWPTAMPPTTPGRAISSMP